MKTIRTPKIGEHWVWLACDKHEFKQLRDLVICGADFEDQAEWIQARTMEHIRCGCQFPADDPETALADLRRDEARHEFDMRMKLALIEAQAHQPSPLISPRFQMVLVALWLMGLILYFVLNR